MKKIIALLVLLTFSTQALAQGNLTQPTVVGAGNGLTKTGNTIDVVGATGGGLNVTANAIGLLTCADTQILKVSGSTWACAADSAGITNSAGANVIPKSDGTNAVASSWTDDGTTSTTTGALTVGGTTTVGQLRGTVATHADAGGSITAWAPTNLSTATTISYTPSTSSIIKGITGGASGRRLCVHNDSTQLVYFYHEDATATATDRITNGWGSTMIVEQDQDICFEYVASRWRVLSKTGRFIPTAYIDQGLVNYGATVLYGDTTIGDDAVADTLDVTAATTINSTLAVTGSFGTGNALLVRDTDGDAYIRFDGGGVSNQAFMRMHDAGQYFSLSLGSATDNDCTLSNTGVWNCVGGLQVNGTSVNTFTTSNAIPKGNGSGLTASSWTDDGTTSTTSTVLDVNSNLAKFGGAADGQTFISQSTLNFGYWHNDTSTGYINDSGYAGGFTQFRNLIVADGKGAAIATFTGSSKLASFNGGVRKADSDTPATHIELGQDYGGVNGDFYIGTSGALTDIVFALNGTNEYMRIDGDDAKVKIGAATEIANSLAVSSNVTTTTSGGFWTNASRTVGMNEVSGGLSFRTNNVDGQVTVSSAGNVTTTGYALIKGNPGVPGNDGVHIGYSAPTGYIGTKNSSGSPASNLILQTTTSGGTATTALTISSTQTATFASTLTATTPTSTIAGFRSAKQSASTVWGFGHDYDTTNFTLSYFNGTSWTEDLFTVSSGGAATINAGTPTAVAAPAGTVLTLNQTDGTANYITLRGNTEKGILFSNGSAANDGQLTYDKQTRSMMVATAGVQRMQIDHNGGVLIGNTANTATTATTTMTVGMPSDITNGLLVTNGNSGQSFTDTKDLRITASGTNTNTTASTDHFMIYAADTFTYSNTVKATLGAITHNLYGGLISVAPTFTGSCSATPESSESCPSITGTGLSIGVTMPSASEDANSTGYGLDVAVVGATANDSTITGVNSLVISTGGASYAYKASLSGGGSNAYGMHVSSTTTATNNYGAYYSVQGSGGDQNIGIYAIADGAVTNNIALYIDAGTSATSDFGIYSNTGDNAFNVTSGESTFYRLTALLGDVEIGDSDTDELTVSSSTTFNNGPSGINNYAGRRLEWVDDWMYGSSLSVSFNGTPIGSIWAWYGTTSATFAVNSTATGRPGVVNLSVATTGLNFASMFSSQHAVNFAEGDWTSESSVYFTALSTASEEYIYFDGFADVINTTAVVDGCYAFYDRAGAVSGLATTGDKWKFACASNSTRTMVILDGTTQGGVTTVNSPVAASTWYRVKIVMTGDTSAALYIDGSLRATITTNIPTGTARRTGLVKNIFKQAGNSTVSASIDQSVVSVNLDAVRSP